MIFIPLILALIQKSICLQFVKDVYNFTLLENSPIDTFIGQINAESFNLNIEYRILQLIEDSSFPIQIDRSSGKMSVALNIDREAYLQNDVAMLSFDVEASSDSNLYAYCRINLSILDVNDNAPSLSVKPVKNFGTSKNSGLYINENIPVNQILAYVGIVDQDLNENGTVKSIEIRVKNYTTISNIELSKKISKLEKLKNLNQSNYKELIDKIQHETKQQILINNPIKLNKINNKMYTIQLAESLKYSMVKSYDLEIVVQDNGSFQLETACFLHLKVIEFNKFEPLFTNVNGSIDILENVLNKSVIYKFVAIDFDESSEVYYKIDNELLQDYFYLDKYTGDLRLKRVLNRSIISSPVELKVIAYDDIAGKILSTSFTLEINVIDLNDNEPKFVSNSFKFSYNLSKNLSDKYLKIASSIHLVDLDSFKTNSIKYLERRLNQTKSEVLKSINNLDNIKYIDYFCNEAFNIDLITNQILPLIFLIENYENLNSVKCKMSIWLDMMKYKKFKIQNFDFKLKVSDNGYPQKSTESSFKIRIDTQKSVSLKTNFSTVYQLIKLDDGIRLNKVNNMSNGTYLIEQETIDNEGYSFMFDNYVKNENELVKEYESKIFKTLDNQITFRQNQDSKISYKQLKNILFDNNMLNLNKKLVFGWFLLISSASTLLILIVAISCRQKKIKNLNVIDDMSIEGIKMNVEIEMAKNLDYDKPDSYAEVKDSLEEEHFLSPYSLVDFKSNYSKLYMLQKQNHLMSLNLETRGSIRSDSPNYIESDEGCYGSSELSSEKEIDSKRNFVKSQSVCENQSQIDSKNYIQYPKFNNLIITESYV